MLKTLGSLLVSILAFPALAGTPYEVADLLTKPIPASSAPSFACTFNGKILFRATGEGVGQELFVTDGTTAGTKLLKDINPGSGDSNALAEVVVMPNAVYFTARDENGNGIFKSDGTAAGTVKATEVVGTQIDLLTSLGSKLLYITLQGRELWSVDVNGGPAVKLATLRTNASLATTTARVGNLIYVGTEQGLLKTDGTPAGTQTIMTGVRVSSLASIGNGVLFNGMQSATGSELWVSDGTAAGTHIVTDLTPGSGSTLNLGFMPYATLGNRAVFRTAKGEFWISDGTSAGTIKLVGATAGGDEMIAGNGYVWFTVSDANGNELWRSDGSVAGTAMVADINPGAGSSKPELLTIFGSRLFFYANDGVHGPEPWITDGTSTTLVRDVAPGSDSSESVVGVPLVSGNRVYFGAYDPAHGVEPWSSDGTAAGTQLLANLRADAPGSSVPRRFAAGATRLYFDADGDNDPSTLWLTDGTASGTKAISSKAMADGVTIGDTLYYTTFYANGSEVWKTDGTAAGTVRISKSSVGTLFAVGGRLYAQSDKLWMLDDAGTSFISLSESGPNTGGIGGATFVAGRPFMLRNYGDVMTVDPGSLVPRRIAHLKDPIGNSLSFGTGLVNGGGTIYFFTADGFAHTTTLWKSDGSREGTVLVKELPDVLNRTLIARPDGSLLFYQTDADHGYELWKSDGTADGTALLKDLNPGPGSSRFYFLANVGERTIFIKATDSDRGTLWATDGTASGTIQLSDVIAELPSPTNVDNFGVADGIFYFRGIDTAHGAEVWQTDGTPAGTRLVADIKPGTEDSYPRGFAHVGNLLYVAADGPADGYELWAVPLDGDPAFTTDDLRVNEADGTATVHVRLTRAATQRMTVQYETLDRSAKAGSDYTAASGTLTFEAGEVDKSIAVAITNDGTPESPKAFLLHLRNGSAPVERAYAAVVIDDDDRNADLQLTLESSSSGIGPFVTNHGPSAATAVTACFPNAQGLFCSQPIELLAGEKAPVSYSGGYVKVSAFERDPHLADNAISFVGGGSSSRSIAITPATPEAGTPATLIINSDKVETVPLVSSDPTILSAPATATTPGSVSITPLKPGIASISTTLFGEPVSAQVRVVAPGDHRYVTNVHLDAGDGVFGAKSILSGRVFEATLDGIQATGTMTFTIDGQTFVNPVVKGFAALPFTVGKAPKHTYSVVYSGDANFFGSSAGFDSYISPANAIFSAASTPTGATIVVHGVPGTPPTGKLTVSDLTKTLVTDAPLVPLTDTVSTLDLTGLTPGARSLYITYGGDDWYWSTTVTIPIVHQRQHAAPH